MTMKKFVVFFALFTLAASKKYFPDDFERKSQNDACNELDCTGQGEVCKVFYGQEMCVCRTNCEESDSVSLVCDSNQIVYKSQCQMDLFACQQKITLTAEPCPDREMYHSGYPIVEHLTVGPGSTLVLNCPATPNPESTTYIWMSNNDQLQNLDLNQKQLEFTDLDAFISGTYKCFETGSVLDVNRASKIIHVTYMDLPLDAQRTFFRSTCLESWWSYPAENCYFKDRNHTRWILNLKKGYCVPKVVDRCTRIHSSFDSEEECNEQCGAKCDQPMKTGDENCNVPLTYDVVYDKEAKSCRVGEVSCGENTFDSYSECNIKCQARQSELEDTPQSKNCLAHSCSQMWVDGYCQSDFIFYGNILKMTSKTITMNIFYVVKDSAKVNLTAKAQNESRIVLINDNCYCGNMAYGDLKAAFLRNPNNRYLMNGHYYGGKPHLGSYFIKSFLDLPEIQAVRLVNKICGPEFLEESQPEGFRIGTTEEFKARVERFEKTGI